MRKVKALAQMRAEERVEHFRKAQGPFVAAAERTRTAMIFTDAEVGRHPVVFANDSFLALTGFDRPSLLGKGIAFLVEDVARPATSSDVETALNDGVEGIWPAKCRCADGSKYPVTIFLSPVRDENGRVRQHFLSFSGDGDHIDRFAKQRDHLHSLYEQAPGFIATSEGPAHRFTFANASYKRLVGREQLVGLSVAEALPELVGQGIIELLDQVFQTGAPFIGAQMPLKLRSSRDGELKERYLSFVYQPMSDSSGCITGLFCEGYDATPERQAAEQLSLLQSRLSHTARVNAMGLMVTTLAHELNQPLTAITTSAAAAGRLLGPLAKPGSDLSEALIVLQEASQRAGEIIRNVREFTKRGETSRSRFELRPAAEECLQLVRAAGCHGVTLENLIPERLSITADRIQIQQVLTNLLRNACDAVAVASTRHVSVDGTHRGNDVMVRVSDTGGGLTDEATHTLFDWAESAKEGGMGIGLSISRTIVEAHEGQIWLDKSDGSGTQFCFLIPASEMD